MRNVDKIKELKKKLAEAERYAARLETMCKGQDKQLMETRRARWSSSGPWTAC